MGDGGQGRGMRVAETKNNLELITGKARLVHKCLEVTSLASILPALATQLDGD